MRKTTLSRMNSFMPTVLVLAGLMLIAIGIGSIYQPAGWIAAGLGAFVIEWRFYGD
ncbi:hypothetical protein [Streptomyces sp. NPDC096153]|uniref:hypothetical protein n=1 Tax=Streptomyces TaxID=1883 RepID=UPI00332BAED2